MSISKSYATFVQNYNIIHMFCTSALCHSCSCFSTRHLHLPQQLSYLVVYIAPSNMKVRRCISILYFIICCCSSVVAPAFCHWQRYMHHRVSWWSFFQRDWNGLLMHCHWAVSLCVLWFHWKLEILGAHDVSAARTLSYRVTVRFLIRIIVVVHRVSTFAVYNPLTSLLALIVSPTVRDDNPHSSFYSLLSFGLLLVTMSSQVLSQRNGITCFPGDPWYAAMKLTATATEFSCLSKKDFFSKAVPDSILQSTALPQDNTTE